MAIENPYKVPKSQWKKWSPNARLVFDKMMRNLEDQDLYKHPKAAILHDEHWFTTRWNAAWAAAQIYEGKW